MQINIIADRLYKTSHWFSEVFCGIKEVAQKSGAAVCLNDEAESLNAAAEGDTVIFIGGSKSWLTRAVSMAQQRNLRCVCVAGGSFFAGDFKACSTVSANYTHSAADALYYMKSAGLKSIAFFGYNADSDADRAKLRGCKAVFAGGDVYQNTVGATECCADFIKNLEKYDGVLCANDYLAVVLRRELKLRSRADYPLKFASFGNTLSLKYVIPDAISISLDMHAAGSAAAEAYLYLAAHRGVLSVCINLKNRICDGGCEVKPHAESAGAVLHGEMDFYGDGSIKQVIRLENFLGRLDELDFKIFDAVLRGLTYEQIEEKYNISVTSIKYRIKKQLDVSRFESRHAAIDFLKYFCPDC